MKIAVIGTNGMLATAFTVGLLKRDYIVDVYGRREPLNYPYTTFTSLDLNVENCNYSKLAEYDLIIYTVGGGTQMTVTTDVECMYHLNVTVPINIALQLKNLDYRGTFITFGSYMEIGANQDSVDYLYKEDDVVFSKWKVLDDYARSKRLLSRFMNDLNVQYRYWHFILPNMFSDNDLKSGGRLIPYTINYLRKVKEGEFICQPSFSSGIQRRQFVYVNDLLNVICLSIEKLLPSGIYNIGGGQYQSIRNLIEELFCSFGVHCDEKYFGKEIREEGMIKSLHLNGSKLFSHINYLPQTQIVDLLNIT